jgi:hypothetical protein
MVKPPFDGHWCGKARLKTWSGVMLLIKDWSVPNPAPIS